MSVDYSVWLVVGFRVDADSLTSVARVIPRTTHAEPRFDRKTGAPSAPEEVVDSEEHVVFVLFGKNEHDFREFCERVARRIKCDAHFADEGEVIFGPKFRTGRGQSIHPHFHLGGDVKFEVVEKMRPELARVRQALEDLRIPTNDPIIGFCWHAG